jgi:thioester reductase-like protein
VTPTEKYHDLVSRYSSVFLTGASGYLGSYLLSALLEDTKATIHCLVRGRNEEVSRLRLEAVAKKRGLWRPEFSTRIRVWCGDLEKPRFGLSEAQFTDLGSGIDQIIHCGAKVSWTSPFESLFSANVRSCQDILDLAQNRIPISHISSIAVLMPDSTSIADGYDEDDPPAPSVEKLGGYVKSKWAGERLMREAWADGPDIRIFRPGLVCGPMNEGFMPDDYFFSAVVKAMVESGKGIRAYNYWEITPVDFAAKAILYLGIIPNPPRKVFHIMNSTGRSTLEVSEMINHYGYPMEYLEPDQWEELMRKECVKPNHAFAHMTSLFDNSQGESFFQHYFKGPMLFSVKTRGFLKVAGLTCPPFDHVYFKPYFDFMINSGLIKSAGTTPPLPPLPLEELGRFVVELTPKPLSRAAPHEIQTPMLVNFGDDSAPDGINLSDLSNRSDALNLRILFDLKHTLSPLRNFQYFLSQIQMFSKNLFQAGRILDDHDQVSVIVHVAHAVDVNGRLHPAAGLFRGFIRALARELPGARVKVILSDLSYDGAKIHIDQEQHTNADDPVVVFKSEARYVFSPRTRIESDFPQFSGIKNGDVILFTGGGRGIGGFLTLELAKRFPDCKFALIGKTAPGQGNVLRKTVTEMFGSFNQENYIKYKIGQDGKSADIRATVSEFERLCADAELEKNLEELRRADVGFKYYSCDITDFNATQRCVADIYDTFSKIDVVIHGAGAQQSKRLRQKDWNEFWFILGMKVVGFLNLSSAVKTGKLRQWINFGSLSAWIGPAGQTDYSAANDCLNSIGSHFNERFPNVRFTTINWHGWKEFGIVSRSRNLQMTLEKMNFHLVDPKAGLAFFLNEAVAGNKDDSQVYFFARQDEALLGLGKVSVESDQ